MDKQSTYRLETIRKLLNWCFGKNKCNVKSYGRKIREMAIIACSNISLLDLFTARKVCKESPQTTILCSLLLAYLVIQSFHLSVQCHNIYFLLGVCLLFRSNVKIYSKMYERKATWMITVIFRMLNNQYFWKHAPFL